MFDVSLVELAVIALVALLVLGPERLPRAARTVGLYVRKARQSWYSVRADIERELAADELKRSLKKSGETMRESIGFDGLREDLRGVRDAIAGDARVPTASHSGSPVSNEALPEQPEPVVEATTTPGVVDGTDPTLPAPMTRDTPHTP